MKPLNERSYASHFTQLHDMVLHRHNSTFSFTFPTHSALLLCKNWLAKTFTTFSLCVADNDIKELCYSVFPECNRIRQGSWVQQTVVCLCDVSILLLPVIVQLHTRNK